MITRSTEQAELTGAPERVAAGANAAYDRSRVVVGRIAADAVALLAAGGAAFGLRFGAGVLEITEPSPVSVRAHLFAIALWAMGVLGTMAVNRLYDEDTLFRGGGEPSRVFRSLVEAMALFSIFIFVTQSFYVSRSWFGLTLGLTGIFVMTERVAIRSMLRRARLTGSLRRPVLLVSRNLDATFAEALQEDREFEIVGQATMESLSADLAGARRGLAIVVDVGEFSEDQLWRIVIDAGDAGLPVFIRAPMRQVGRDRLTVRELAGQTIVKISPPMLGGWKGAQKRILDLVIGVSATLLTAPIMTIIALAILVADGRPILYRQTRVGRRGHLFDMYKFRTMHATPTIRKWTTRDDPRRTTIGRFLRRTSLDELPQLWNVLRGDMSIVGPRPEQPTFAEDFAQRYQWYGYRDRIKPGITGWAQAHGLRGDTPIDERLEFDNWYIENWSIGLDLRIFLATVRELVRGKDAY